MIVAMTAQVLLIKIQLNLKFPTLPLLSGRTVPPSGFLGTPEWSSSLGIWGGMFLGDHGPRSEISNFRREFCFVRRFSLCHKFKLVFLHLINFPQVCQHCCASIRSFLLFDLSRMTWDLLSLRRASWGSTTRTLPLRMARGLYSLRLICSVVQVSGLSEYAWPDSKLLKTSRIPDGDTCASQ